MISKEQLCRFSDPDNPKICGPFSFGDFSYVTNGHVLIRVPRLADVPQWEAINQKAAAMFDGVDYAVAIAALVDIPNFPRPEPETCTVCQGNGKISICPECDGEGEVTLENDFHSYECECQTCDGEGKVYGNDALCMSCNGTGKKKVTKRVLMGCTGFSSHYLTMLKELPGVKVAPLSLEGVNYFKWDEGDGLLMPMRV